MYARVTAVPLRPGTGDEALRVWRETLLPRFKQQPGFKGLVVLANRSEHRGMSITFWDSEASFLALQASGFLQQVQAATEPLRAGPALSQEGFEVVLYEDV